MVQRVYEPEVLPARDPFAEKIAWLMEGVFRVGRWSVGLDGLLGLVPGFGDVAGAIIGLIIVARAAQAGVPHVAIARMVTNIAIDTFVGSIPILGDLFDFAYKSNSRNLRIYEDSLRRGRGSEARHWGFFVLLLLGLGAVMAIFVAGLIALAHRLAIGLHL